MFQLNVTIGLNPETLNLLSKLFAGGIPAVPVATPTTKIDKPETPKGVKIEKQPEVVNGHAPAASEPKAEVVSITGNTATQTVTIEQVRAVVQAKAQAGKREEVKNLLQNEFQAANVLKLPAEQYGEFLTKLEAL